MRSSVADRTRPTPADALAVLLILLAAGLIFWSFRPRAAEHLTAAVTLDGAEIARFDLSRLEGPVTYEVPGAPYPITLEAQPGRIRVLHSGCPTQDCVHTGWADRDRGQIICLPNRLAVSLSGGTGGGLDAVTG